MNDVLMIFICGMKKRQYIEPIILHYFHGMTQVEISKYMKIPLGTVATFINRGLRELKKELIQNGYKKDLLK